jgi:GT2 family glycosyltransferase
VDDGSSDGTADAIAEGFPSVTLLQGDGSLYWNGGMRLALRTALQERHDYVLWLNDDTILDDDALVRLVAAHRLLVRQTGPNTIVVGATRDPVTGTLSYGGLVAGSRLRPLRYTRVPPANRPTPCDTMNGNCVLLSGDLAGRLGTLDRVFTHGMGDIDYGLRARRRGCRLWVAPGYVGICAPGGQAGTWRDPALSLAERWRHLRGPKGLPIGEWATFARRHGGVLWPLFWLFPYARFAVDATFEASRRS